jgi:outer membrane protein OmpA-like peptidoglycan-associated protein
MNTRMGKVRNGSIGVTLLATCLTALPVHAQQPGSESQDPPKQKASKQQNIGVATGFAVGAVAGGPIGAFVGAAAGAWLGDRYHKQAEARSALAADLGRSESDRTRLTQDVRQLNGSLAHEQEQGKQLGTALSHTDQIEMDVSFRTNDDSIQTPVMSPLLKLGALAAAMPDAKVRVAGYADIRGSDSVNDALSQRRAEAVAAVLETAGLAKDRLIVEAHGKSEATSAEGDVDGYAFDRRVTVRIERTDPEAVARNE